MNKSCIFCDIANKKINSFVIFEDDQFISFFDIYSENKYHFLLIAKSHSENFYETDNSVLSGSISVIKSIQTMLQKTFPDITGFNVFTNQGKSAGQMVFHFHWHIVGKTNNPLIAKVKSEFEINEMLKQING